MRTWAGICACCAVTTNQLPKSAGAWINRPQFNRYLSGRFKPSAGTLRRICDFFGVEVHEILLPHNQFQRLVQVRPGASAGAAARTDSLTAHLDHLCRSGSRGMDRYIGYYFEYYQSMSTPGMLIRTLVCIEEREGRYLFQRTERMKPGPGLPACHNRYQGCHHAQRPSISCGL